MTRLRLRELHGLERLQSVERVMRWGFPREVNVEELVVGHWFEWGPEAVFWLVPDGQELSVHVATAPGCWLTRRVREWEAIVTVLADLLGANAVYAWPIHGSASGRAVVRLLRGLGWTEYGPRWYLSLRGDGVGIEQQEAGQGSSADGNA